ncbi:UbiD family decarboxylase, partial [Chloroflexota bacterium]
IVNMGLFRCVTAFTWITGYRLFGGGAAKFSRLAVTMDMDQNTHPKELIEEYLRRTQKPIKPILVADGPCKENIHLGDEVDLLKFPVPMVHDGDGGLYIGTWHITVSQDFDSDWVNWGMYRHMLHNKNTVAIYLANPQRHLGAIYFGSYEPKNKPMEVAIAIGTEPVSALCATTPMPYGVSEVDVAGGIRGEPVELVKCETIDLAVPATAEIVIEGEIRPHERMDEGPFGEYTGYLRPGKESMPVIHVKAVTHRNNPIFTMSCMGVPVDDNCVLSLTKGAGFLKAFRERGLPVTGVYCIPETSESLLVVAVKAFYSGIAADIAHIVWGTTAGRALPYLIIVEDDVDPFNISQVLHALCTKCHPSRGIVKMENGPIVSLLPFLDQHEQQYQTGTKVYFDCTWPRDWDLSNIPKKVSFAAAYPLEVQQKALAKGW